MDPFQVRQPDDTVIQLSHGHWVLVRKWLTAGENNKIFSRMVKSMKTGEPGADGKAKPDVEYDIEQMGGLSLCVAYLADWSMKDPGGRPLVILNKKPHEVQEALESLPPEGYDAIKKAIEDHVERMKAEQDDPKNEPSGSASPSTSTSAAM